MSWDPLVAKIRPELKRPHPSTEKQSSVGIGTGGRSAQSVPGMDLAWNPPFGLFLVPFIARHALPPQDLIARSAR